MSDIDNESADIWEEIWNEDIYRRDRWLGQDELWVDLGCHVGIFSQMVNQVSGSNRILVGIDSNPDVDIEYVNRSRAPFMHCEVRTARQLLDITASELHNQMIDPESKLSLKMDIQGAEIPMLFHYADSMAITGAFDRVLMEVHGNYYEARKIANRFHEEGLELDFMDKAVDILTNEPTYIIHSVRLGR